MTIIKNIPVKGKHDKPIVTDVLFENSNLKKPLVIFCHGYKGYKDWGAWHLMCKNLAKQGLFVVTFNFSHNGGTLDNPIDFPDLEAFSNNNYSIELDDLQSVIDWATSKDCEYASQINAKDITLMGHSRGGGIVLIKAEEHNRISKVITLASVSDYGSRFPKRDAFIKWKEQGVYYVENGRTKQQMPHKFQFFEDYEANKSRLSIERACKHLKIPHLILHGTNDTSVKPYNAENLDNWSSNSTIRWIGNANHVFNTQQPWNKDEMSEALKTVTLKSVSFIKQKTTS